MRFDVFSLIQSCCGRVTAVAAGSALALMAGCTSTSGPTGVSDGPMIDPTKPVQVALLIPKSYEETASIATSLEQAAQMAIADLGGIRIDLRVFDTAGNPEQAALVARQAVQEGAKIILGPLLAENAKAVGAAVADSGVNVLSFSNNASIAGNNVFVLGPTFNNTANRLVSYAASQGRTKAVIVHPRTLEGELGKAALENAAQSTPLEIVAIEAFEFSQKGVIDSVARIKDSVLETQADTLFLTSNTARALPLLVQLLPEAGINPQDVQYIGLSRWDIPRQILELPGVQNGWFTSPSRQVSASFKTRFTKGYGSPPHQLAGLAYDGLAAIGALVSTGQKNAVTKTALTQASGFQGVSGVFRFLADGTNERALAIAKIERKKVVLIDAAPVSFGRVWF
ncbi:MAG: penicillin-binding protein activator [Paracoccaceae bacterium]|jgi:ABC-type branched-subunit amino acid transport system substrate-binding protein|nr:penicillin-binding protein activator [Paracoccaceae bacterium]|tara:strand:+ start:5478 stop:6668 length:1191 start_codon:yes stop_codon:yes gene_type:complete